MSELKVSAGHYLYVRQTDVQGNKTVHEYRVWNNQIALQALATAASGENIKAVKEGRKALATVESIDEATYRKEK